MSESGRRKIVPTSLRSLPGSALLGMGAAFLLCMLFAVPVYRGSVSGRGVTLLSYACPVLGSWLSARLYVKRKENAVLKRALLLLLVTLLLYLLPVLLLSKGAVTKTALPLIALESAVGILAGGVVSVRKGKLSPHRKNRK